jgi:ATP-dependent Clp protease protease subunit
MQFLTCPIMTYCIGQAASMASVLLTAGTKGKRFALPNSRIMIHQPSGGFQGQASDIRIQAEEILKVKGRLNQILAQHTGQPVEKIEKDSDRDYFMSADEAKKYGLVDEVVKLRREIEDKISTESKT